jgi:uncharacterized protein (TIGR00730 family)
MKVAVFGGASTEPGDKAYEDARRLGALLGRHGHTVMTGGYGGVMKAASRGCSESGGHTIGVTCTQIERLRGAQANQWVMEEIHLETLRDRMYALIDSCDAAIGMPGGVGTMCELMVMWNEMIINNKPLRPLIFVGSEWQAVISQFIDSLGPYIRMDVREIISLVPDIDSAYEKLNIES